jgi:hypothetical protein
MKARCVRVAAEETPESVVEIAYRSRLSGSSRRIGKEPFYLISVPRPHTRRALAIYLHEIAHCVLGHFGRSKLKAWEQERDAEAWAFAKMREHGIAVPRKATRSAKAYVARKKEQGRRCAHRHQWVDFPKGYPQRGQWERCLGDRCNAMRPIPGGGST